jgi:inhibitor of KinA
MEDGPRMSQPPLPLQPLGDQAVLAYALDEAAALAFAAAVRQREFPWVQDVVQAYTSVAIFYEPARVNFTRAKHLLAAMIGQASPGTTHGKLHEIPCCYELGLDFARVSELTGLNRDQIIHAHCQTIYTVYAIGFCPGFPYLGYLPDALAGVPRLPSPRLKVAASSIGLTGRQTGIYTEERPGGWNIVGRTPLELVHVADVYFPIRTGDRVQFRRIDRHEFDELKGQRLENDE